MPKQFVLKPISGSVEEEGYSYEISDEDARLCSEVDTQYRRSYSYMLQYFIPMMDFSWKKYRLCEVDRESAFLDKADLTWRANVSSGVIREAIDNAASYLKSSMPLPFVAEGADEAGMEHAQEVSSALTYAGDATGLHRMMRHGMLRGMIEGVVVLKAVWVDDSKETSITVMEDGIPVVKAAKNCPYVGPGCVMVDPYSFFPDFYPALPDGAGRQPLRFVAERGVCSLSEFKRTFGQFLRAKSNRCPIGSAKVTINGKETDAVDLLLRNDDEGVSKEVYGWEKHEAYRILADKLRREDGMAGSASQAFDQQSKNFPLIGNWGRDLDLAQDMVEWRLHTTENVIVLKANGFPVAIKDNELGIVNYVAVPFEETDLPIGAGIGILLRDLDMQATSFVSGFIDNVKASMNKAMLIKRNQISPPGGLPQYRKPGEIIYVDGKIDEVAKPLETGTPQDYGVLEMISRLAQRRTGMSDYNSGIAARERTAMGATELTEALMRRMGMYLANLADGLSSVARIWLEMMRRYWEDDKWIFTRDDDGKRVGGTVEKSALLGGFDVSVEIDGMLANNNAVKVKRATDFANTFGEISNVSQIAKYVAKLSGLPTNVVVVQDQVGFQQPQRGTAPADPAADIMKMLSGNPSGAKGEAGQDMQDAMSSQVSYK